MNYPASIARPAATGSQLARLILIVVMILSLISLASQWYAEQVSLPRYCAQPDVFIQRIAEMNSADKSIEDESRRNYMIAAKLEFIEPRNSGEPVEAYLNRLRYRLEEKCR